MSEYSTPSRTHRPFVILSAALVFAACSDTEGMHEAAPTAPDAQLVSPQTPAQPPVIRTIADEFRGLGRRAPGFTGVFYDKEGNLTISVATDNFSPGSEAEVMRWASIYTGGTSRADATPRITRVAFDYLTLDRFYQQVRPIVGRVPGTTSLRIDEQRGEIVVTVAQLPQAAAVRSALISLELPREMLVIEERAAPALRQGLQNRIRPVVGGLQIARDAGANACSIGLLGWKKDPDTGHGDPNLGLFVTTASHCSSDRASPTPDEQYGQPTISNLAGFEVAKAPIFSGGICPYTSCQLADVLAIQLYDSVPGIRSLAAISIQVSPPTNPPYSGRQAVTGQGVQGALTGERVYKVGRSTGQTFGLILESCVDSNSSNDPSIWTLCNGVAAVFSRPGDSGAPVWVRTGDGLYTPRIAGVLWGGTTNPERMWFSPTTYVDQGLSREYQWTF